MNHLSWLGEATHWGLTDWHDTLYRQIAEALRQGPKHEWTTGWYACGKTGTRGCITCKDDYIECTAVVYKGRGTPAHKIVRFPFNTPVMDIDILKGHMGTTWQMAEDEANK